MPPGRAHAVLLILSSLILFAQADQPWNCQVVIGKSKWDLHALGVEKTVRRTRTNPPSSFEDEVRFNVCGELAIREGVDKADQCPSGSLACYTETNKKPVDGADRITTVIPLVSASTIDVQYKLLSTSPSQGILLTLHGPSWPPPTTSLLGSKPRPTRRAVSSTPQSLQLKLLCPTASESESDPKFVDYDTSTGVMSVEWTAKAACPMQNEGGDDRGAPDRGGEAPGGDKAAHGSGMGTFFLFFFLAFGAYFALGAYYNYNNYGASGWDLVPHRDFWREVPYLVQDLFSHLCSSVRPGGSRSGYVSV